MHNMCGLKNKKQCRTYLQEKHSLGLQTKPEELLSKMLGASFAPKREFLIQVHLNKNP